MTDDNFDARENMVPGYLSGMMLLSHRLKPAAVAEGAGNPITAVRRSDAKVIIQYSYCCNEIDVSKSTLKEAIEKKNYI